MKRIIKILTFAAVSLLISLSNIANSQTYTTLVNGDWSNSSSVWSTNGTTACNCSPSSTINGFKVVVKHNITMDVDVDITGSSDSLIVTNNGSLSDFSKSITVTDGFLYTDTSTQLEIKELIVGSSGKADLYGDMDIDVKWAVEGTVNVHGTIVIKDENLEIKSTGTVTMHPGASVTLENKDLIIDGTLNINSACFTIDKGNVENKGGAFVTGNGLIRTVVGNITNSGTWSAAVLWCAGGSDSGMPTIEDCSATCASVTLPIELISFETILEGRQVVLKWTTAQEINNDHFTVECSINGVDFEKVMIVKGAGTSNQVNNYSAIDATANSGTAYYRIKQTDFNGEFSYSPTRKIKLSSTNNLVELYPNPAKNQLNVSIRDQEFGGIGTLTLFNQVGRAIINLSFESTSEIYKLDISNLRNGVYHIQTSINNQVSRGKFVKY